MSMRRDDASGAALRFPVKGLQKSPAMISAGPERGNDCIYGNEDT